VLDYLCAYNQVEWRFAKPLQERIVGCQNLKTASRVRSSSGLYPLRT
jgi:hypothetical protein